MLSYLRIKSGSWIVKAILATMAIGLTFFYGFNSFRKANRGGGEGAVATVNGEAIDALQFENTLKNQREVYSKVYGGEVPEFLEKTLRQNVLDGLVEQSLLSQWAKQNEVPVSRREVADKIVSNPQFAEGDPDKKTFNAKFYKEQFRPWFREHYGLDYEQALKDDLRVNKAMDFLFKNMTAGSDKATALAHDLDRTLYHFKQVVIDPKVLVPADQTSDKTKEDGTKTPKSDGSKEAETLAGQVLQAFGNDAKVDALLKPLNIAIKDLGEKKLSEWRSVVPAGPDGLNVFSALLALNANSPLPNHAFQVGGKFYVYKWIGSRIDDKTPATDHDTTFASLLNKAFADSLHSQATIELKLEE